MDDFQREVPVLFKKYEVKKKIGQGAFGAVYLGKSISDGRYVAIKVEKKTIARPSLESEAFILTDLKGIGIPEILSYGKRKNYTVLVEPLLGENLFSAFIKNGMCFALEDMCLMSIQIIERIQFVHSRYIIHRDIKPDNFLIGRDDPNIIYLVDFGLSKKYRSSKTKKHVQFSITGKLTGTIRFSSPNAIRGGEQSRKDDLISIGYMIIFLMKKKLPWQNIKAQNDIERYIKIYKMKKTLKPEILCQSLPEEMTRFMRYVLHLGFEENPNYKYLGDLFKSILKKHKLDYDKLLFSWIKPSDIAKIKNPKDIHKRKSSSRDRLLKKISRNLDMKQKELSSDSDNNSYEAVQKTNINPSNMRVVRNDSKDNFDLSVQLTQNNSKIGNTTTLVLNFEKTINNQLIAVFDEVDNQMESKDTLNNNKETTTFEKEKLSDMNVNILNKLKQNKNNKFINSDINKIKKNLKPDKAMNQKNNKIPEFSDISMGDNIFSAENNAKYRENFNLRNENNLAEQKNLKIKNNNNEINSFNNINFKNQETNDIYDLLQNKNNGPKMNEFQENNNLKNKNLKQNLKKNYIFNEDSNQPKLEENIKNNTKREEGKNQNKKTLIDKRVIDMVNALKNNEKNEQNFDNKNNNNSNNNMGNNHNNKMLLQQNQNNLMQKNENQNNNINKGNILKKNMNNKNNKKYNNNFNNQNELNLENINNIQQKLFNKKNKNINSQFNPNNTENNQRKNELMPNQLNNNLMFNNNFNNDNFIMNTEPTDIREKRMKLQKNKNMTFQKNLTGCQNNFNNDFNNFNNDLNNNNDNFGINLNNKMNKREDFLFPDNSEGNAYSPIEEKMMNRKKGKNPQMNDNYSGHFNNMEELKVHNNQIDIMNNMKIKNKMKNMKNTGKMKNINNLKNNNNMNNINDINNIIYQNKMNNMKKMNNMNNINNINNMNNMRYIAPNSDSKKNQRFHNNFNAHKNQDIFQQPKFNNMNHFPDNNNYNFNMQNNNINYTPFYNDMKNIDTNFGQYSNFPDDNI